MKFDLDKKKEYDKNHFFIAVLFNKNLLHLK
jgi:hypothetical protein